MQRWEDQPDDVIKMFEGTWGKDAARGQWLREATPAWTPEEQETASVYMKEGRWVHPYDTYDTNVRDDLGNQGLPSTAPQRPGGPMSDMDQARLDYLGRTGGDRGGPPLPHTKPDAPSAPTVPSVADWQKTATSPWGGTIQFTPGGAVYRVPEGRSNEWMQANQDYLMREGFYLNPEQFGQHMGIDIYEPGYVPGTYSPTQGVDPAFSQAAWDAVDQYPGQKAFRDHVRDIQIRNQQQAIIDQMAADMYGGGGFGGFGGGGGAAYNLYDPYNPYNPYGTGGGIPPAETGSYPATNIITGEPSFAGDPTPSDPFINLAHAGLGALASSAPAGTRDRLRSWLAGLGYTPQGVFSGYGESEWKRPEGQEGPAAFTDADFNMITDPAIREWIRWLMGEMGYSADTLYPGAVAP